MNAVQRRALDPNQAVSLFFFDPDWRVKAGVGGVIGAAAALMLFLSPFLIPVSFVFWALLTGYNLRLLRAKIGDIKAPLPSWNDFVDLFISGLTWIAVLFAYSLVILSVSTVALFVGAGLGMASDRLFIFWAIGTVIVIVGTALLISFFGTVNMINFAREERTSAAFDLFTSSQRIGRAPKQFLQAWLLFIGLQLSGIILPVASVVGVPFIPIISFSLTSIAATILAQAWRASEDPTAAGQ